MGLMLLKPSFTICLLLSLAACGNPSSSSNNLEIAIDVSNLIDNGFSYLEQNILINSNRPQCSYTLSQDSQTPKILHLEPIGENQFKFRNPIVYQDRAEVTIRVAAVSSLDCPYHFKDISFNINKFPTEFGFEPRNIADLDSRLFQVNDIGFGGLVITDRYTATICYPTANDCESIDDEFYGQDAHNMAVGDFNGDGHEDFVVAWSIFPHTIEEEQKLNAPINVYLNDGNGRYAEDISLYASGKAPTHPFVYRTIVADFNGDGLDDIFAGSMGIQVRGPDYDENYIEPYPHLLLLSNESGKLVEEKGNIEKNNHAEELLCSFAHDASAGDVDGDHDIDLFVCNILLVNDGSGQFDIHPHINQAWKWANQLGNPMSSLVEDLNNDGFDDLLFWSFDNRSSWSSADEGYILLSNNTPQVEGWELISLPVGPFGYDHNKYNHAAAGDFNGDGYTDVVVAITRDVPYYEGAYIQVLMNNGAGALGDETSSRFSNQPRAVLHQGEGNIYTADVNLDGHVDIIHSTRDHQSGYHGVNIAINSGAGIFTSIAETDLPMRPREDSLESLATDGDYNYLTKGLPINADDQGCLDLISATKFGLGNPPASRNYLFTIISKHCDF